MPEELTESTGAQSGWRHWLRRVDSSELAEQLSVNFGNHVFNSAVALFIVLNLYGSAAGAV